MTIIDGTITAFLIQISNLVSVAYDTTNLRHDTINQDVFLGDANLRIQAAVPEWATLTGDNLKRLEIITMKQCAINILTAFARVKRESVEDLSQDNDQLTPAQAIARYEDDISTGIKVLNPLSTTTGGRFITAAVIV